MVRRYGWVAFLNSHFFVILVECRNVCQNTENIDIIEAQCLVPSKPCEMFIIYKQK